MHNQKKLVKIISLALALGMTGMGVSFAEEFAPGQNITQSDKIITAGVWVKNSHVELNNSTVTGNILYAGNAGSNETSYTGSQAGQLYIRGGSTDVDHIYVWDAGTVKLTGKADLKANDVTVIGRDYKGTITQGNNTYTSQDNDSVTSDKGSEKSSFRVVWGSKAEIKDSIHLNEGTLAIDGDCEDATSSVTIGNMLDMKNGSNIWMGGDAHLSVKDIMAADSFIRIYQENGTKKDPELDVTGTLTLKGKFNNDNPNGYMETGKLTANVIQIEKDARFEVAGGTFHVGTLTLDGQGATQDTELVFYGKAKGTFTKGTICNGADLWVQGDHPSVTVTDTLNLVDEGQAVIAAGTLIANHVQVGNEGKLRIGSPKNGKPVGKSSASIEDLTLNKGGLAEVVKNNTLGTKKLTVQAGSQAKVYDTSTFNAGMVTLDGTGATGDTELAYLGDSKGTLGQVRITKGANLWLGGNEGNPTVQITDSLAVSDGGKVIVASGTLTANQVQIGNQGVFSVGQIPVSTQSMARSAVVQNGNATFQAGNLSLDTGAKVEVNQGSSLETNKLTMQAGSTVTVSGANSVYTVKGEENTIASGALLKATNQGTVTFASGSATSATAGTVTDGKSKVSTIATASNGGQVKVEDGAKLFIQNSQRNVNYDLKDIITTEGSGSQTDGTFSVYGKNGLHAGIQNEDGSYSIQGLNDSDLENSLARHVIAKADENGTGKLSDFINHTYGEATNGNIDRANAAMNQALGISAMGGVMHGTYGFAENVSTLAVEHKADGAGLWASYLRHDEKVDGFKVGHEKAKYDVKYNGFAMGGDFAVTDTSRTGVAFAYADGSINAKNGTYTKTDTKYYGADVYHHFTAGGVQYTADVGYIKSDNDLKQINLGETITGSVDGNTFFMGIRAEKPVTLKDTPLGNSTLTPYVGLRYYRVHLGDFTDTLGVRHETENADIWNLPIGVEFRNETKNGNWTVTPLVEVGYRFAMGDKNTKEKVHFDGASDTFSYDIGENAFLTRLGVEAKNDSLSLAGGYRYQKGSDTQSNQWYVQLGYRF